MNAVGTEWVTPGLPRMIDECSGYGMGHVWVTEDESNPVSTIKGPLSATDETLFQKRFAGEPILNAGLEYHSIGDITYILDLILYHPYQL